MHRPSESSLSPCRSPSTSLISTACKFHLQLKATIPSFSLFSLKSTVILSFFLPFLSFFSTVSFAACFHFLANAKWEKKTRRSLHLKRKPAHHYFFSFSMRMCFRFLSQSLFFLGSCFRLHVDHELSILFCCCCFFVHSGDETWSIVYS